MFVHVYTQQIALATSQHLTNFSRFRDLSLAGSTYIFEQDAGYVHRPGADHTQRIQDFTLTTRLHGLGAFSLFRPSANHITRAKQHCLPLLTYIEQSWDLTD